MKPINHRCEVCGEEFNSVLGFTQHKILCNEDLRTKYEANIGKFYTRSRCVGKTDVGLITGLHGCQYYTVKCVSCREDDRYSIIFDPDAKLSTVSPITIIDRQYADDRIALWSATIPEGFFMDMGEECL